MPDPLLVASLYRLLPSLDKVLQAPALQEALSTCSRDTAVSSARAALARIRRDISSGIAKETTVLKQIEELPIALAAAIRQTTAYSLRRVINATGVILHTNLGRAPLSRTALDHLCDVASDYSNLELDLESGGRSRRDVHAESLLLRMLMGHQDEDQQSAYRAVVVNNCAAATFLVLNSLAEGGEVIVSRGELVEIGGGFRIPDILRKSGAILREVGTTNRTRLADYQSAISERTALILRVHQSNFRVQGFTERPRLEGLISLARRSKVPLFEDQGTGLVASPGGLIDGPDSSLLESMRKGPDVIAASGDKLLGGPQCGLVAGRRDLVEKIAKNPLTRAFRVCKLTYAALEGTLMDYLTENSASVPVIRMLALSSKEILGRCERLAASLRSEVLNCEVVGCKSVIGGGTTPGKRLKSFAVALRHTSMSADQLASALRQSDPAVLPRIKQDAVLLDLRTVRPESDMLLKEVLESILSQADRKQAGTYAFANGTT
jgi:L-seryl-tRNA(Ser) seleniumtransferase